jgi:hypothetical protein
MLEVMKAVNTGKTSDYQINNAMRLLALLNIGVTIDINDLSNQEANLLIELKKQIQLKQEREASIR